jgi:soluble cytochrome b562
MPKSIIQAEKQISAMRSGIVQLATDMGATEGELKELSNAFDGIAKGQNVQGNLNIIDTALQRMFNTANMTEAELKELA